MNDHSFFPIGVEHVIQSGAQAHADDWRLLRRLALPRRPNNSRSGTVKRALVLDVETTGRPLERDEVIQLAMLPFTYELEAGRILEIDHDRAFDGLREPGAPISDEASLVTGLTAEAVAGRTIDGSVVEALVADADLIIAHNASFDRVMVEKHWPCFARKPWGCTLSSVNWLREGFSAGKLDYLGMQLGWFYDGHRALADCEACLALLAQELPQSGQRVISAVRDAALRTRQSSAKSSAEGRTPYHRMASLERIDRPCPRRCGLHQAFLASICGLQHRWTGRTTERKIPTFRSDDASGICSGSDACEVCRNSPPSMPPSRTPSTRNEISRAEPIFERHRAAALAEWRGLCAK